jgi:hypothetical protein
MNLRQGARAALFKVVSSYELVNQDSVEVSATEIHVSFDRFHGELHVVDLQQ